MVIVNGGYADEGGGGILDDWEGECSVNGGDRERRLSRRYLTFSCKY